MKKILLLTGLVLILASCASHKKCADHSEKKCDHTEKCETKKEKSCCKK